MYLQTLIVRTLKCKLIDEDLMGKRHVYVFVNPNSEDTRMYDVLFGENTFIPEGRGAEQRQLAVGNARAWSGGAENLKDATVQREDAR
jgi:hypothetical protein